MLGIGLHCHSCHSLWHLLWLVLRGLLMSEFRTMAQALESLTETKSSQFRPTCLSKLWSSSFPHPPSLRAFELSGSDFQGGNLHSSSAGFARAAPKRLLSVHAPAAPKPSLDLGVGTELWGFPHSKSFLGCQTFSQISIPQGSTSQPSSST